MQTTMSKPEVHPQDRTAVHKAMNLLQALSSDANFGLGVTELAKRSGLTKSTAFRLLQSLQKSQAVEHVGRAYRLGPLWRELTAQLWTSDFDEINEAVGPFLGDLFGATRLTTHLAVLQGVDVMYLNKLQGHEQIRTPSRIGGRIPAHCTALGKVLLAYNADVASTLMGGPLVRRTSRTLISGERLEVEFARIRDAGMAFDREESTPGVACVAAPMFAPDGRIIAAVSVSGPAGRFLAQATGLRVQQAASMASRALGNIPRE